MTTDQPIATLLSTLKALIRQLPTSCPRAPKDGPIHRSFGTFDVPDGETPYYAIDQAWTRVFQGKTDIAIGGKYGVGKVYDFFSHFSREEMGNETSLLQLRIEQFVELVKKELSKGDTTISSSASTGKDPHLDVGGAAGNMEVVIDDDSSSNISRDSADALDSGWDESDEVLEISAPKQKKPKAKSAIKAKKTTSNKQTYKSPKKHGKTISKAPLSKEARVVKEKKAKMQIKVAERHRKSREKTPQSGSSGDERESDGDVVKVTTAQKGKISTTIYTTPRTLGVKEYCNETLARPQVSNFSSHLKSKRCKIPAEHAYGAVPQSQEPSTRIPNQTIKLSPENDLNRRQRIMHDFTERAKESPAPKFSREGFRVNLVKAIIRDGLPFRFTEGAGIKQLFKYSLPSVTLPSRHTIRRDLDLLYGVLREELRQKIKAYTYLNMRDFIGYLE
ncbi:hypothetical protein FRC00_014358 [Tulasnella sp. 408]|nr:hypothetical protein FRC00_014358 [Tulasnella sp. 408]